MSHGRLSGLSTCDSSECTGWTSACSASSSCVGTPSYNARQLVFKLSLKSSKSHQYATARLLKCKRQSPAQQTSVKAHLANYCSHWPPIRGVTHVQAALHDAPQRRHNIVFCQLRRDVQTENATLPGFSGAHLHQQTTQSLNICFA